MQCSSNYRIVSMGLANIGTRWRPVWPDSLGKKSPCVTSKGLTSSNDYWSCRPHLDIVGQLAKSVAMSKIAQFCFQFWATFLQKNVFKKLPTSSHTDDDAGMSSNKENWKQSTNGLVVRLFVDSEQTKTDFWWRLLRRYTYHIGLSMFARYYTLASNGILCVWYR